MMYYDENSKWYLYGIVSYGITFDNAIPWVETLPSFHTQVPSYLSWIEEQLNTLDTLDKITGNEQTIPDTLTEYNLNNANQAKILNYNQELLKLVTFISLVLFWQIFQ